jgi:hypothetical protein
MSDKKLHSGRGTVGPAEELETYGVWVKNGPQDFTTAFGAGGFDGDDLSFGADFNSGFTSDFNSGFEGFESSAMSDIDGETRLVDDDFPSDIFSDELETGTDDSKDDNQEDMPTQILMKMADEITSIRSELTMLKKEFEDSLTANGGLTESQDTSSSDEEGGFQEELSQEDLSFDSRREEDEAALRNLSELTESSTSDVGMKDDQALTEEESITEESFGELDDSFSLETIDSEEPSFDTSDLGDTAFNTSAFDTFSLDETAETAETADTIETTETETVETAPVLTDVLTDELSDELPGEIEGSSYLEDDPFASIEADFEDMSLIENALEESELEENPLEIKLDESDFDFDLTSLSADPVSETDDEISLESLDTPASADSDSLESLESSDSLDSIDLSDIAEPSLTESSLDESFDLGKNSFTEDSGLSAKPEPVDDDSGIAKVIPEAFEEAEEEATPFDDDLDGLVEEELSADIDETNIPGIASVPQEESAEIEITDSGEKKDISPALKGKLREVLSYMDHLLESLPEEKIEEFAHSEHFDTYKRLFKELDLA